MTAIDENTQCQATTAVAVADAAADAAIVAAAVDDDDGDGDDKWSEINPPENKSSKFQRTTQRKISCTSVCVCEIACVCIHSMHINIPFLFSLLCHIHR